MTEMDLTKIMDGLEHVSTLALLLGAGVGLLCANLDADGIEADGWPRLASAIRLGRRLGGLALQLRSLKAPDSKPPSKGGAS